MDLSPLLPRDRTVHHAALGSSIDLPWHLFPLGATVIDLETTGVSTPSDRIVEVSAIKFTQGGVVKIFDTLVNPNRRMAATHIHRIRRSDVINAPTWSDLAPRLIEHIGGSVLIAHNAPFERRFLTTAFARAGIDAPLSFLCSLQLSRRLLPERVGNGGHSLSALCNEFRIKTEGAHAAMADVLMTIQLLCALSTRHHDEYGSVISRLPLFANKQAARSRVPVPHHTSRVSAQSARETAQSLDPRPEQDNATSPDTEDPGDFDASRLNEADDQDSAPVVSYRDPANKLWFAGLHVGSLDHHIPSTNHLAAVSSDRQRMSIGHLCSPIANAIQRLGRFSQLSQLSIGVSLPGHVQARLGFDEYTPPPGSGGIGSLSGLESLRGLQVLHLHATKVSPAALRDLGLVCGLLELSLSIADDSLLSPKATAPLRGLKSLEHLIVWQGSDLLFLDSLTRLRMLSLHTQSIGEESLVEIAAHPSINFLRVERCQDLSDSDFHTLATMPALSRLSLRETSLRNASIGPLSGLGNLTHLDVSWSSLSCEDLAAVAGFSSLEYLAISGRWMDARETGLLAQLPNLKVLDCSDSDLQDEAACSLMASKSLRTVNFSGTKVSRDGLVRLVRGGRIRAIVANASLLDRDLRLMATRAGVVLRQPRN
jgi:DNA polymerase III epsilon subunit family exonuclease